MECKQIAGHAYAMWQRTIISQSRDVDDCLFAEINKCIDFGMNLYEKY
jgi:hypothetical protein